MNTLTLAITTARGLLQQKTILLLLAFSFFLLGSASLLTRFSFEEELFLFQESTLGVFSFFLSIVAIIATALVFSFDSKTPGLLLLLSRPLPRYRYLLGRLLGIFLFLSVVALLMSSLFFLLLLLREQAALKALQAFPAASVPKAMEVLQLSLGSVIKVSLLERIFVMLLESWVLSAATMVIATMASSSFFTIIMSMALYFVGHLKEGLQAVSLSNDLLIAWSHRVLMAIISLFPDLSIFEISDRIDVGATISTSLMAPAVAVAFAYSLLYFLIAAFFFQRREW
ncbi:MAG: hypothetical protein K2W99_03935 [Chthoniobacterales bacterium]|nr:hypothetical protein [Chthoniobacterales bacterium]